MAKTLEPITHIQMRRLALVRHLYDLGVQQSRGPEPTSALALLPFHDAAEMYLLLACERHDAGGKRPDFMEYFTYLEGAGIAFSERESMRRMNKARVAIKHNGVLPAAVDVEGFRQSTTNFLHNNAQIAFGIDFDRISLVSLIQHEGIRRSLEAAEKALADGKIGDALAKATAAFALLIAGTHHAPRPISEESPYSLRSAALRGFSHFDARRVGDGLEAKKLGEAVVSSAEVFSEAITLIGHGLDFTRYLQFKMYAPVALLMMDGSVTIQQMRTPTSDPIAGRECVAFVVDTAIRLEQGAQRTLPLA